MLLQLDPRIPLVWRSPSSLQFGVTHPHLVLDQLSAVDEQLIAALQNGSHRDRLVRLASAVGGDANSVSALLTVVAPLLVDQPSERQVRPGRVLIDGVGHTAASLRREISNDDLAVSVSDSPEFVVIIGQFAIAPRRYGQWLRHDVPLIPVVFGENGVDVGPLVVAGRGPCLYCLDLARTDADPIWPAIASQLIDRETPSETLRAATAVASVVGAAVHEWFGATDNDARIRNSERWIGSVLHIEPNGWVSHATHTPHPACGCQLLNGQQGEVPAPPENAMPFEVLAAAAP